MSDATQLKFLAHMVAGGTPETTTEGYWSDEAGMPWVSIGDMSGRAHVVQTAKRVTPAGRRAASLPAGRPGTLLFAMYASVGEVAVLDVEASWNQALVGLVPKTGFDRQFLFYALSHLKPTLAKHYRSNTQNNLNAEQVGNLSIPSPPLVEQREISYFLDREMEKIDALIAKQRGMIGLLGERRTGLLRQVLTRGGPGWTRLQIRRLSPVLRGASPRPIDDPIYFDEDGTRGWVRIGDVTRSEGRLRRTEQKLSDLGASLSVPLEPGDLFLSIAASVGKPCIPEVPICIHDGFVYFPAISWPISGWLFRTFELGDCFGGLGKLGTQLNLNTDTIGGIEVALPPVEHQEALLREMEAALAPLDRLIAHAEALSTVLRERRSALITAAVTGQIDVTTYGGAEPSESVTT